MVPGIPGELEMFRCTIPVVTPLFRTSALCQMAAQGSDLITHAQIPRDKHRPPPVGWLEPLRAHLLYLSKWTSAGHALRTRPHLPGCRSRHSILVRSGSLVCPTYSPAKCGLSLPSPTRAFMRELLCPHLMEIKMGRILPPYLVKALSRGRAIENLIRLLISSSLCLWS